MRMSTSSKGLFVSFEGIDGCGKSTQVQLLYDRLLKEGFPTLLVREPGGTDIAENIRTILLNKDNNEMSPRTEALLMTASRAQLTKEKIIPSLRKGFCVIADRFKDSTLAYQSGGRGLDMDYLISLNDFATQNIEPDLTIFLDIDAESSFQMSKNDFDRIESAGLEFQNNVRKIYIELAEKFSDRFFTINARDSISIIHSRIWEKTIKCLNEKN